MKKLLLLIGLLLCSPWAIAANQIVNVYNWSGYMPDDVLIAFEKETGIHVNYSTYDSNETMYAKLKADPRAAYDIVVPSTYFIDRMRKQKMLQKIDKERLTNFTNLNPDLLNKEYDPGNNYSIPYFWSATGIAINTRYIPSQSVTKWADFWNSQFKDQILLLDDAREVFSIALITLGYLPNDTSPEHIKEAYLKLKALMPNVKLFNDEAVPSIYIDEDALIGMGWNGDIYLTNRENSNIQFIYPQEGFVLALDSMAIPSGAQHLDNAYKFINYVLRPDVAKKISMETGYATPNLTAVKMLPTEILANQISYPDSKTMKRAKIQTDVGEARLIYEKYWELLKIGG